MFQFLKRHKNNVFLLITVFFVLYFFLVINKNDDYLKKIEPAVLESFETSEYVSYIVKFKDIADVDGAVTEAQKISKRSRTTPVGEKNLVRNFVVSELQSTSENSQQDIIEYLDKETQRGNVNESESFYISNAMLVESNQKILFELAKSPSVSDIYENAIITLDTNIDLETASDETSETNNSNDTDDSNDSDDSNRMNFQTTSNYNLTEHLEKLEVSTAWERGIKGNNIVICVIDTGVDLSHPILNGNWRGNSQTDKSTSWYDAINKTSGNPIDNGGHGTHVAGIAVGGETSGGLSIGVAPEAQWIAVRTFDTQSGTFADILRGCEWALAPRDSQGNLHPELAPDIINCSWSSDNRGYFTIFEEVVSNWRSANILPVFSAGNSTLENLAVSGSVTSPGNYDTSFTVGSVELDNKIASYSLLGPSPSGTLKPDVVGYGSNVYSSFKNQGYGSMSGTSMSTPQVSGLAALILQANSSLSVDDIEDIISGTTKKLTDSSYPNYPNNAYGYGVINVKNVMSRLFDGNSGTLKGLVKTDGVDSDAPVIVFAPVDKVFKREESYLSADISDNNGIKKVYIDIKAVGANDWTIRKDLRLVSGNLKSGSFEYLFTNDVFNMNNIQYKITAVDTYNNETETPVYSLAFPSGITVPYSQDFETDISGFNFIGTDENIWSWGEPKSGPTWMKLGKKVVSTSLTKPYLYLDYTTMQLPIIDLRDNVWNDEVKLKWTQWFDFYKVPSQTDIGSVSVREVYNDNTFSPTKTILKEYDGSNKNWHDEEINLQAFSGKRILVEFTLKSNPSYYTRFEGWFVDNIKLTSLTFGSNSVSDDFSVDNISDNIENNLSENYSSENINNESDSNNENSNGEDFDNENLNTDSNEDNFGDNNSEENQTIDNLDAIIGRGALGFMTNNFEVVNITSENENASVANENENGNENTDENATENENTISNEEEKEETQEENEIFENEILENEDSASSDVNKIVSVSSSEETKAIVNSFGVTLETSGAYIPIDATVTIKESGVSARTEIGSGIFSLFHRSGNFTLVVEASGYVTKEVPIQIKNNTIDEVYVTLSDATTGYLKGSVQDEQNRAIENAQIRILSDVSIAPIKTGASGDFQLSDISEGTHRIRITSARYKFFETDFTISNGQMVDLGAVTLQKLATSAEKELYYDNDKSVRGFDMENIYAAVKFEVEGKHKISSLSFYFDESQGDNSNKTFQYMVFGKNSDDGSIGNTLVGLSSARAEHNGEWTVVNIPNTNVYEEFYVALYENSNNLKLGIANKSNSNQTTNSFYSSNGSRWTNYDNGNFMIRAVTSKINEEPKITDLILNSTNLAMEKDETFAFNVKGYDTDNFEYNLTNSVKYKINDGAIASVDNTGNVKALSKGQTTLTVTHKNADNSETEKTVPVKVSDYNKEISHIVTEDLTIKIDESKTLAIYSVSNDNTRVNITSDIVFTNFNNAIIKIENGTVTGLSGGITEVRGVYNDGLILHEVIFDVEVIAKRNETLTPSTSVISMDENDKTTLSVFAKNNYNEVIDVTENVSVSYGTPNIATFDNSNKEVIGKNAGYTEITITYDNLSCTVDVTVNSVTPPTVLDRISLSENNVTMEIGTSLPLFVKGHYSNGSERDLTNETGFGGYDTDVCEININGEITAKSIGETTIVCNYYDGETNQTFTKNITVKVEDNSDRVIKIYADRNSVTLEQDDTADIKIFSESRFGVIEEITDKVNFAVADSAICSIDADGEIIGKSVGSTSIAVSYADNSFSFNATFDVHVNQKQAVSEFTEIFTEKTEITLEKGQIEFIGVYGRLKNNTSRLISDYLSFTSSDSQIVVADANGNIEGIKKGNATILITYNDNIKTFTTSVDVKINDNSNIFNIFEIVTKPNEITLDINEVKSFRVIAIDDRGAEKDITSAAQISASNSEVATLEGTFLNEVRGIKNGTATVNILAEGFFATLEVTVGNVNAPPQTTATITPTQQAPTTTSTTKSSVPATGSVTAANTNTTNTTSVGTSNTAMTSAINTTSHTSITPSTPPTSNITSHTSITPSTPPTSNITSHTSITPSTPPTSNITSHTSITPSTPPTSNITSHTSITPSIPTTRSITYIPSNTTTGSTIFPTPTRTTTTTRTTTNTTRTTPRTSVTTRTTGVLAPTATPRTTIATPTITVRTTSILAITTSTFGDIPRTTSTFGNNGSGNNNNSSGSKNESSNEMNPTTPTTMIKLNPNPTLKYLSGYENNNIRFFKPDDFITRAEFSQIIFNLIVDEDKNSNNHKNSFKDVRAGEWFYEEVSYLSVLKVLKGYEDNSFKPNNYMTRAEASAVLSNFIESSGNKTVRLNDIDGHWAYDNINKLASNGYLNGYTDGSFLPDSNITRAELVTVINKMLNRSAEKGTYKESDNKFADLRDTHWAYDDIISATK